MKKIILSLIIIVFSLGVTGCLHDDPYYYKHCTHSAYPFYCDQYDSCCPVGFPYDCWGSCYMTWQSAWDNCGRFGGYIDACYIE